MHLPNPFQSYRFLPLPSTPTPTRPTHSSKTKREPSLRSSRAFSRYYATWTSGRSRRATKAALALQQLILDPPILDPGLPASTIRSSPKTTVSRLSERDVNRLRTQLLKPDEAGLVIAQARTLSHGKIPERAVCLDCGEEKAEEMIKDARRTERLRLETEKKFTENRFATIKGVPPGPPQLPVLLSLLGSVPTSEGKLGDVADEASILPFGLLLPASALSLHRPLAGALPSADTLKRGFDALLNAESKIYLYEGPDHSGIHAPIDRLSIYTCMPSCTSLIAFTDANCRLVGI